MVVKLNFKNSKSGKPGNVDASASSSASEPNGNDTEMPGNVIHIKAGVATAETPTPDWRDLWELHKGRPVNNHSNAMIALRNDPSLNKAFAFDEMGLTTLVLQHPPGSPVVRAKFVSRPLRDVDVSSVQEYLQKLGLSHIGAPSVHQAIDARAHECAFHPVRDYLEGLVWDGTPRLPDWLPTYVGVKKDPYSVGIGRMFLLSMVARIYLPGCKCDYTVILEAPQGSEKSTVCRVLGGRWFSDSLPETSGKDAAQHLAGKWLVELGEMAVMSKWEGTSLKAFLTRQEDKYRPPYGRTEIIQKRQCVFIGTTNQSVYLKDSTGGRRFWPVVAGKIDNVALAADRDQLFAETVAVFKAGEKWHPNLEFEKNYIQPQQEARFEEDSWEDVVRKILESEDRIRVGQILCAIGFDQSKRSTRNERRVTDILHRLGWRRDTKKDADGNISWVPNG